MLKLCFGRGFAEKPLASKDSKHYPDKHSVVQQSVGQEARTTATPVASLQTTEAYEKLSSQELQPQAPPALLRYVYQQTQSVPAVESAGGSLQQPNSTDMAGASVFVDSPSHVALLSAKASDAKPHLARQVDPDSSSPEGLSPDEVNVAMYIEPAVAHF
jgi:hypothetical protein